MKRIVYIAFTAILFSWSAGATVLASNDPLVEKRKNYSKSYAVGSNERIMLNNSFGEMKINTWDKNEVKVDITIIAKAATDEKAQEILNKIRIEDGKNSDGVYFKTHLENMDNNNKGKKKDKNYKEEGMEINYVVYLPAKNPLNASNSFGALIIGNYQGEVSLESKFGRLSAGNLSNVKQVLVEFGKADIELINNGKVTIKFSKADLGKFSGNVNSNFEFCDVVAIALDNTIVQLNVKSSYSTLEIGLNKGISANFDIKTSFGDIDNGTIYSIEEEKEKDSNRGPKFDKRFYGTAGKGAAKITIKSDFGKVKFL